MIRRPEASLWTSAEVYKLLHLVQDQHQDAAHILDSLPFAIAVAAADGMLLSANDPFVELFALRRDALPDSLPAVVGGAAMREALMEVGTGARPVRRLILPHPEQPQPLRVVVTLRRGKLGEVLAAFELLESAEVLEPGTGTEPESAVAPADAAVDESPATASPVEPPALPVNVVEPEVPVEIHWSPDQLVLSLDAEGQMIEALGPWAETLGWEPQDLAGQALPMLVSTNDRLRLVDRIGAFLRHDLLDQVSFQLRRNGHGLVPVTFTPVLRTRAGQAERLDLLVNVLPPPPLAPPDPMEAIARQAQGIGRELSGQLQVIYRHTDILLQRYSLVAGLRDELEQVHRAAGNASDFANRLLAAGGAAADLHPQPLPVASALHQAEPMLRALAGPGLQMEIKVEPGTGAAIADLPSLERALVNLTLFCRDSMPQGGTIRIQARDHDMPAQAQVSIEVMHDGEVLTQADREHLFEPFYTMASGRNFGMSLAEALGIVRQAKGDLWLASEAGTPARFLITLPRQVDVPREEPSAEIVTAEIEVPHVPAPIQSERAAMAEVMPVPPPLGTRVPERKGPKVVCLVEPATDVRGVIRTFLERGGFEVLEASEPGQAMHLAKTHHSNIDLVLTAVHLPGQSGYALADEMKQHRPDMDALFMTGYMDDVPRDADLAARLIQKPFTARTLILRVKHLLGELAGELAPPAAVEATGQ